MENTNYKGKTNEELAIDFLNSMVAKEKKTERHFKILLNKYKAWDKKGVEDVVNNTIDKVYGIIIRNGFKDGYFQAYFESALENNLLQQLKKNGKEIPFNSTSLAFNLVDNIQTDLEFAEYEQDKLDRMMFAFNQLAESSKEVLYMITDKQKYKETQRALNLSEGQVKMRTRKARAEVGEYQKLFPIKTWEKIKEVDNHSVSRLGQIRNDITGKFIRLKTKSNDYQYVTLITKATGKVEKYLIHELVYKYHGDEHDRKGYVYHLDLNSKNNQIDNLLFDCI